MAATLEGSKLCAAGNYDVYIRTRAELEENQMKKYKWEQEQIANMKDYIARFGHGSAKLARQAQVGRNYWAFTHLMLPYNLS